MRQSREVLLAKKREWARRDRRGHPEKYRLLERQHAARRDRAVSRATQARYRDGHRDAINQRNRDRYWQNHDAELRRGRSDPQRVERSAAWRKANPEKYREHQRNYCQRHKEQIAAKTAARTASGKGREAARRWRAAHPVEARAKSIANKKRIRLARPEDLILRNCVNRMVLAANMKKSAKSRQYIGCHPQFLRNHLEEQFRPGMSWDNYGSVWVVDHIVPLSWWDLRNHPEHLFEASHWTNLQPLFVAENLAKKDLYCGGVAA